MSKVAGGLLAALVLVATMGAKGCGADAQDSSVVVGTRCEHPRARAHTKAGVEVTCRDDGNGVLRWRYV